MTEIEAGRYVCLKTRGFLAWVIRMATHSRFNHVVVAGPDGQIVEARPSGVRKGLLSEYAGCEACANLDEPMTVFQRGEVWSAAEKMCGAPYDFPDLLAIEAANLGWHWNLAFKLLGAGPWRICSQLAAMAGKAAYPPLNWFCKDRYADQVTPAALARRPGVVPVTIG